MYLKLVYNEMFCKKQKTNQPKTTENKQHINTPVMNILREHNYKQTDL